MKVLHLINSLNTGGAEKLLLETLPIYNQKVSQVDLLLLNSTKYPFLMELENQHCCTIFSLNNGSVYNPLLIFKIIPFLKKYDIIHAHLFPSLYWLAIAKTISFSKTKIVYTEHNTSNKRRYNILYQFADRLIYRMYNKIITIAYEVDSNLKKHLGLSNKRIHLIPNGVDTALFSNALTYSKNDFFSKKDYLLIQVSSFREQKDQPTLIRALKILPNNYKLLLVGEGPFLDYNKDLVKELKLEKRVKFLGIRMDVPKLLKTANIIVLSSHHEGLSLSSIEAMASGKPFIASDVPGLREIVKGAGLLFTKGDEKELAKHILELSNNQEYYDKIVKQCSRRAQEYDIKFMVDGYIEVYKNLLA